MPLPSRPRHDSSLVSLLHACWRQLEDTVWGDAYEDGLTTIRNGQKQWSIIFVPWRSPGWRNTAGRQDQSDTLVIDVFGGPRI